MIKATKKTSSTAPTLSHPQADTISLNFSYSRSWFQTPNSYDAEKRDGMDFPSRKTQPAQRDKLRPAADWIQTDNTVGGAGSAFEDRNLRRSAIVDALAQFENGLHSWVLSYGEINTTTIRAAILLPIQSPDLATGDGWSESYANKCWTFAHRLVRQGNPQHKGGSSPSSIPSSPKTTILASWIQP